MKDVYINKINSYDTACVFAYLRDIQSIYESYDHGHISYNQAYSSVCHLFYYVKGYLHGLGVKHLTKIFFVDNHKCEYISFYSNSSKKVKYVICVCLEPDAFAVKYNIKRSY